MTLISFCSCVSAKVTCVICLATSAFCFAVSGLRCRCHFALQCPDLLDDRRGTKHLHSPSATYSPGLVEGELLCVEFSLRVC